MRFSKSKSYRRPLLVNYTCDSQQAQSRQGWQQFSSVAGMVTKGKGIILLFVRTHVKVVRAHVQVQLAMAKPVALTALKVVRTATRV